MPFSPRPVTFTSQVASQPAGFKAIPMTIVGPLPAATTATAGGVKKAATVANATDAASVILRLNDLLTSLRAAGVIV